MQSVMDLFRLSLGGLFLEAQAYQEQRDTPNGLTRGFLLVALVGLLVGVAAFVGDIGQTLTQPDPAQVQQTIYDGLTAMPWFSRLQETDPGFIDRFDIIFTQVTQTLSFLSGGGIVGGLIGIVTTPLLQVLGWLLYGTVAYLIARALGGKGSFSQTLAATALVAGVNLLGIVQIIPFAQLSGTLLLGLIASYVAIREVHQLSPWRTFWASAIGPIIAGILVVVLFCAGYILLIGMIGNAIAGGINA